MKYPTYIYSIIKTQRKMKAQELKNKKITMATLKSFVRKSEHLFVSIENSFDGMVDCVVGSNDCGIYPVSKENAIGINGVGCVGSSRDYFEYCEEGEYFGIRVFNCCGSAKLLTK